MDTYLLVKWLHIVSSTVLFGFGAGTAWYLWNSHLTGDAALIAKVGRMVVKADWIFTGTSGVLQPVSGILLIKFAGYSLAEPWLLATYALLSARLRLLGSGSLAADQSTAPGATGRGQRNSARRRLSAHHAFMVCPRLASVHRVGSGILADGCQTCALVSSPQ